MKVTPYKKPYGYHNSNKMAGSQTKKTSTY